ncbi:MAG: sensor histidine kinase [Gemmatimonadaceae bacterium]
MTTPTVQGSRFRLLPDDKYLGWTPYAWLAYFPTLFLFPALLHSGPRTWLLTTLAGIVFLPLYFRGYWARGREKYAIIAVIAALGVALVPINAAGGVFFIYAAAFAGHVRPQGQSVQLLAALCITIVIETLILQSPPTTWIWELMFVIIVGGVNVHYSGVHEMNKTLFRAREEIEHLATVAERERIARDLHDLLGHTLSLITIKAALASRVIDRDPERAAAEIRDVERISRDALSEVRSAVAGYRSAGLARELANAELMLDASGVRMSASMEAVSLSSMEEAVFALALREGVTNVVRHAEASTCRISLGVTDGTRTLRIEDDGCGKHAADGNGLTGMRERVAILGGTVTAEFGSGTRLRITIPVTSETLNDARLPVMDSDAATEVGTEAARTTVAAC